MTEPNHAGACPLASDSACPQAMRRLPSTSTSDQFPVRQNDVDETTGVKIANIGNLDRGATKTAWSEIDAAMTDARPNALPRRRYPKVAKAMLDLWVVPAL